MNRINTLFQEKKNILSIYYTAGYPNIDDTMPVLEALQEGGAELVEIGMPFSDPLADGETIQLSSHQALENGMTIKKLFEQLSEMRKSITIPIVLMGYYNPVFHYGIEKFIAKCKEIGVDGLILPDLPFDEYKNKYKDLFENNGISNIFLITPQTSDERVRLIDENSTGFIYMVSSASVTGAKSSVSTSQVDYFKRIDNLNLKNPKVIGFGIGNHATFSKACENADGAIIGSAFVNLLTKEGASKEKIVSFLKEVKGDL